MSRSRQSSASKQDTPRKPHSSWLAKFDRARREIERYIANLPEDAARKFRPVADWMQQVMANEAPELLNDTQSRD
ncbi:MAG: hypothetical protein ACFFB3_12920 [Candidatus Hodarchaeota archaeon]